MIADRKFTNKTGTVVVLGDKLFEVVDHIWIGYAGSREIFNSFRNILCKDTEYPTNISNLSAQENFVTRASGHIIKLTRTGGPFTTIIAFHAGTSSKLYQIDLSGNWKSVDYSALGSGRRTIDYLLGKIPKNRVTMNQFAKEVYFHIKQMNDRHPALSVGFGEDSNKNIPTIRYLGYTQTSEREPTKEELNDFKKYADAKISLWDETIKKHEIINQHLDSDTRQR